MSRSKGKEEVGWGQDRPNFKQPDYEAGYDINRYIHFDYIYVKEPETQSQYQFRIAIDPLWLMDANNNNLVKNILSKHLVAQDGQLKSFISAYKWLQSMPYEDATDIQTDWFYGTRDNRGRDRDEWGKEVCIYLQDNCGIESLAPLKEAMLGIWKDLIDAGAPLATALPAGDRAITANGNPTPFSYTFMKDGEWENPHGILFKDININPDVLHPNHLLNFLEFSTEDLTNADISSSPKIYVDLLENSQVLSTELLLHDIESWQLTEDTNPFDLDTIIEKLDKQSTAMEKDRYLKAIKRKCPGEMYQTVLNNPSFLHCLNGLEDSKKQEEAKATLNGKLSAIEADFNLLRLQLHPSLQKAFGAFCENSNANIKKNPLQMQRFYCRLVHLNNQTNYLFQCKRQLNHNISQLVDSAIQNYLTTRESRLSCFFFDKNRGRKRAEIFKNLFAKYKDNPKVTDLLIFSVLSSHDGVYLKECIVNALGFENRKEALNTYRNKIQYAHNIHSLADKKEINKLIATIVVQSNTAMDVDKTVKKLIDEIDADKNDLGQNNIQMLNALKNTI